MVILSNLVTHDSSIWMDGSEILSLFLCYLIMFELSEPIIHDGSTGGMLYLD